MQRLCHKSEQRALVVYSLLARDRLAQACLSQRDQSGIKLACIPTNVSHQELGMSLKLSLAGAALAAVIGLAHPAAAETVVRYGISMADVPLTTGQPDRGAVVINLPATPSMTRWSRGKWMSPIGRAS
jgi:hypothetical protein